MILVDANVLVYATTPGFPQHDRARVWLDARLNGREPIGLPWPSLLAFVRLVSNPRVFERPRAIGSAWGQVSAWLGCEPAWVPAATDRHREILGGLAPRPREARTTAGPA